MRKSLFKYLLLLVLAYPATTLALPPDLSPAPADWPNYDFHKMPGTA